MPPPEYTKKLIETRIAEYCDKKIPEHARDKVRLLYKINRNKVTLIETRPFYCDPLTWTETPIAQFRFDIQSKKWVLYYIDGRSKWNIYDLIEPSGNLDDLLKKVDLDTTRTFWR